MYFAYEYVRNMNMIGHEERTCSETPDIYHKPCHTTSVAKAHLIIPV